MQSRIAPAYMRLFTIFGHFIGGHGVLVSILIMVLGGPLRYRRPALLRMSPILVWVASEIVLQPFIRTLARRCTLNASFIAVGEEATWHLQCYLRGVTEKCGHAGSAQARAPAVYSAPAPVVDCVAPVLSDFLEPPVPVVPQVRIHRKQLRLRNQFLFKAPKLPFWKW